MEEWTRVNSATTATRATTTAVPPAAARSPFRAAVMAGWMQANSATMATRAITTAATTVVACMWRLLRAEITSLSPEKPVTMETGATAMAVLRAVSVNPAAAAMQSYRQESSVMTATSSRETVATSAHWKRLRAAATWS